MESQSRPLASFQTNEANLLFSLVGTYLLATATELVERTLDERSSCERFRTLVLKCARRATLSTGYTTLAVDRGRAAL